jgi:hypothetical protein
MSNLDLIEKLISISYLLGDDEDYDVWIADALTEAIEKLRES